MLTLDLFAVAVLFVHFEVFKNLKKNIFFSPGICSSGENQWRLTAKLVLSIVYGDRIS